MISIAWRVPEPGSRLTNVSPASSSKVCIPLGFLGLLAQRLNNNLGVSHQMPGVFWDNVFTGLGLNFLDKGLKGVDSCRRLAPVSRSLGRLKFS
jgi:hypothetical protein